MEGTLNRFKKKLDFLPLFFVEDHQVDLPQVEQKNGVDLLKAKDIIVSQAVTKQKANPGDDGYEHTISASSRK